VDLEEVEATAEVTATEVSATTSEGIQEIAVADQPGAVTCSVTVNGEAAELESHDIEDLDDDDLRGSRDESYASQVSLYPEVCRNEQQFRFWQKSRSWLTMNPETNSVQCSTCASVKYLGLHKTQGQHDESAFVDGSVASCKSYKILLKKADKHRDSLQHKTCERILKERQDKQMQKCAESARTKFVERNREKVNATTIVFCTAYECAQSHLSFREHERLLQLQAINGLKCGEMLYSHHACAKCPLVQACHCMAHRLELAIKNATDTVNESPHFRSFVD